MESKFRANLNYPVSDHMVIDTDENVIPFVRKNFDKCQHIQVEIDTKALELTCLKCGVKVNPVMWIKDTMQYWHRQQSKMTEQKQAIKEDQEELKKRARTRCQHCSKMTAINLKNSQFQLIK